MQRYVISFTKRCHLEKVKFEDQNNLKMKSATVAFFELDFLHWLNLEHV